MHFHRPALLLVFACISHLSLAFPAGSDASDGELPYASPALLLPRERSYSGSMWSIDDPKRYMSAVQALKADLITRDWLAQRLNTYRAGMMELGYRSWHRIMWKPFQDGGYGSASPFPVDFERGHDYAISWVAMVRGQPVLPTKVFIELTMHFGGPDADAGPAVARNLSRGRGTSGLLEFTVDDNTPPERDWSSYGGSQSPIPQVFLGVTARTALPPGMLVFMEVAERFAKLPTIKEDEPYPFIPKRLDADGKRQRMRQKMKHSASRASQQLSAQTVPLVGVGWHVPQ
ncbi:MAG: hypothetical protein M1825_000584 [Sarcosagium campestre]|nr:MAG: hypothetical protein M1825_000584 [Sarcosagium campestre]